MKRAVYGSIEIKRPIGMDAELMDAIKKAAKADGMSWAEWVRQVARRELKRREVAKERAG